MNRLLPQRHSTRLRGYDYSLAGAYFVTICVADRACHLAAVEAGRVRLSAAGSIVESTWQRLPERFPGLETDAFIVMPNHVHGVVLLPDARGSGEEAVSLGEVVRSFKAASSRLVRVEALPEFGWQRNYHDRIIRNDRELQAIREYIVNNPLQWHLDHENPEREVRVRYVGRDDWDVRVR